MGWRFSLLPVFSEKAVLMEVKLYIGNLSRSTTMRKLSALFAQAGEVTEVNIIADRLTGGSKGYGYVTMSAQSEADRAVSMFNSYSLDDHHLKVALVKPREQRGLGAVY
jgi:RNA recognition motif-containing protein